MTTSSSLPQHKIKHSFGINGNIALDNVLYSSISLGDLASIRVDDDKHVRLHSTTRLSPIQLSPTTIRKVLHAWGNVSLLQHLQLDSDGTWLIDGLLQGTVEVPAICTVSRQNLVGTWAEESPFAGNYRGEIFGGMALALVLQAATTFLPEDSRLNPVKLYSLIASA